MTTVPAVEVGGSHVTATRVDPAGRRVCDDPPHSQPLDPHASAQNLIAAIAACALWSGPFSGTPLCLAVPGPFDYLAGVARYEGVGKFDALHGVDLRAALREALPEPPDEITFVNDAVAFTVGEWVAGAGRGAERIVGITLGTGVGSAFLDNGGTATGVHDVVRQARGGDDTARRILRDAYHKLGVALAPWVSNFDAAAMVIGGSIAQSWDVIGPLLSGGLASAGCQVDVRVAAHPLTAPHIGAVWLTYHQAAR
jgi:glucokinase